MNSQEFYLWLNGYLEALESEGITECKIKNIRKKMEEVKTRNQHERVVFGASNINQPPPKLGLDKQGYITNTPNG